VKLNEFETKILRYNNGDFDLALLSFRHPSGAKAGEIRLHIGSIYDLEYIIQDLKRAMQDKG